MRIDVTQDDIDKGQPNSCSRCPVARAVYRATGAWYAEVTALRVNVWQKRGVDWKRAVLPPEATRFIKAFDNEGSGEPFSFDLDL